MKKKILILTSNLIIISKVCNINLRKPRVLHLQVLHWRWLELFLLLRFLFRFWSHGLCFQWHDHCYRRVLCSNDLQVGFISIYIFFESNQKQMWVKMIIFIYILVELLMWSALMVTMAGVPPPLTGKDY